MFSIYCLLMIISIALFLVEAIFVFSRMNTKLQAYLLLYLICAIVNNAGYLFEITATNSEAAYIATRMLYLGKIFMSYSLLLFVLLLCRIKVSQFFSHSLFLFHSFIYIMIATNDLHHLYYSSITFVTDGFFPHNVYGHGPLYFLYISIPFVYAVVAFILCIRGVYKVRSKEEKSQLFYFLLVPITTIIGLLVFFSGKTGGFDTSNLGLIFSSIFMLLAIFKYNLIDTVDMVKTNLADSLEDGLIAIDNYGDLVYNNRIISILFPKFEEMNAEERDVLIEDIDIRARTGERLEIDNRIYAISKQNLEQKKVHRGTLFVFDDITETVKYTKEIEEERDRADEANAAKSNFLSNMSHEIRTPMNAIVGMTDIMLRNNPKEQDIEYLNSIKSSGTGLLDIINDILDISKIESGKMEIVEDEYEPLPMLNDLKMIFQTRVGDKPVRLIYEIDEKLPAKLYGDGIRVRQIIINLMNNAIKFTDVGFVKLKLIVERLNADNINLKVSVQDSGSGIRKEDMERLFGAFNQVALKENHSKEGTGLGLTISKQLVELMNGTIGVSSTFGEGSDFHFEIPQKVMDDTPACEVTYTKKSDNFMNFAAPRAKILLVEDNEINVRVAEGLMAPLGFKMDVANNGLVALKKVSENKYDLVFMDHMMPVMDGVEATKKIRGFEGSYFEKLPIIALTANAVVGAKEEFLEAGMNGFISKPINMREVCSSLKKWLPKEYIEYKSEEELEKMHISSGGDMNNDINGKEDAFKQGQAKDANTDKSENERGNDMAELDRNTGISYCGTEELYESVLEDFYRLIDTKSEKIEELFNTGNIRDYTIEVHALKSTARMIGAQRLSDMALEMEQAGNANDVEKIKEKNPPLMALYREYKEVLSYFDAEGNDDEKLEVPVGVIKGELIKMNMAVKDFDMDGIDEAMENLNKYKMPTSEAKSILKELDTKVRDVDFDAIPSIASELMKNL